MISLYPIIVVTGANGGVGFGICHRLLIQLSQRVPPDSLPQPILAGAIHHDTPNVPVSYEGLTLIMACRSTTRAEAARSDLYCLLEAHIARERRKPGYDGFAETFRRNLKIDICYLDLGIVKSVFRFSEEVSQNYSYVSHIVCNAGIASFTGIDWIQATKQICLTPLEAVTVPKFNMQNKGELSVDGLGWVWQCNVFGHYALFRSLQRSLLASPPSLAPRVVWTSSIEAFPLYDPEDWQLTHTAHSYEASKYQTDILAAQLDRRALKNPSSPPIRHFISQPGIASTNIQKALVGILLDSVKLVIFYVVRIMGSPHHVISPFKAAIAAVHLCLVSAIFIPSAFSAVGGESQLPRPTRFGAETGPWGDERVGMTDVREWKEHEDDGLHLLEKCETLYQSFQKAEQAG